MNGRVLRLTGTKTLLLAVAAAALAGVAVWIAAGPRLWDLGPYRPFEGRLVHPPTDVYRPFAPRRSDTLGEPLDLKGLAALRGRGDLQGVVAKFLLGGALQSARAVLATATGPELRNARAVLSLLDRKPEEALAHLEPDLARHQHPAQTLWNRALALRDLELEMAASTSFDQVAELGEPGWAAEARRQAEPLRAQVERRKQRWLAAQKEARALATAAALPARETLERFPDLMRVAFYDALAGAATPEVLDRLAPLAQALDASHGGDALARAVGLARRRASPGRASLAQTYAALAARDFQEKPEVATAYLDRLRASGERDLLHLALVSLRQGDRDPDELRRLAAEKADAWLDLQAVEITAMSNRLHTDNRDRERALRQGLARARALKLEHWIGRLDMALVDLMLRDGRAREAGPLARELRAQARARGDWDREVSALRQLARIAAHRNARALLQAYADEVLLADGSCRSQRSLKQILAERALIAHDYQEARRLVHEIQGCADGGSLRLPALHVLAELAWRDGLDQDWQAFQAALAQARPRLTEAERAQALAHEGRALLRRDPALARGRLREAIAAAEALPPSDLNGLKTRLQGYRTLIADASASGDHQTVLDLMAKQHGFALPERCLIAVTEDHGRMAVAARTLDGQLLGDYRADMPHDFHANRREQEIVPPAIRQAVAGCPEVAVLAEPPFQGRPRLLAPGVAWRHQVGGVPGEGVPVHRRLVVSDVAPPPGLGLPPLSPWRPGGGALPQAHLRGPEATAAAILREMALADWVELHVHGVVDLGLTDASFLVVAPDADGRHALTAAEVRQLSLPRHPVVILAACDSASNESYAYLAWAEWSLPAAFIKAGARAVFAATAPIPDREASEFFANVSSRLASGNTSPAVALREARVAWLARGPAESWVEDIVLFQ